MAWTAPLTAVSAATLTAAQFNSNIRDNFNETETAKATGLARLFMATGTNAIAERECFRQKITTAETTTDTSYVDLDTAGPAVTLTTGTQALVFYGCWMENTGASNLTAASIEAMVTSTGTVTIAASDTRMLSMEGVTANNSNRFCVSSMLTGLTAGQNTFTMKYRVAAGTGTFSNRECFVIAL